MKTWTLALAVTALLTAPGCIVTEDDGTEPSNSPSASSGTPSPDASPQPRQPQEKAQYSGTVGGSENRERNFEVDSEAPRLVVRATYSVGGSATFTLLDPAGDEVKKSSVSGGQTANNAEWYSVDDPAQGEWTFKTSINGGATYDFRILY